ncbi:hypothetical protein DPMN_108440 [Dreissena polymorpha]|uniref:Uncharacterized protein n=1 Tax=Dreissena polymorpha TaxID=45954 RepID=A0A9D4K8S6_DREPO|nr:hypothetical protein DPMN_108440 [Dreissena polymorpha]
MLKLLSNRKLKLTGSFRVTRSIRSKTYANRLLSLVVMETLYLNLHRLLLWTLRVRKFRVNLNKGPVLYPPLVRNSSRG